MIDNYPVWRGPAGNGISEDQQEQIDAAIAAAEDLAVALPQVEQAREDAQAAAGQAAGDRTQTGADRAAAAGYARDALVVAATMIPGKITFGWLTDSHYASRTLAPENDRWFNDGLLKTTDAITAIAARGVDFVVHGGDLIQGYDTAAGDQADAQAIIDLVRTAGVPSYFICGNHDVPRMSWDTFRSITAIANPGGYYHFDLRGVRFIFFDACYNADDDASHYGTGTSYTTVNKYIPPGQRAWLADRLAEWPGRFVFFSHQPFGIQQVGNSYVLNADAVHAIMLPYADRILAVISGHSHRNLRTIRDGIVHYETEAVTDGAYPSDAWGVITIEDDVLSIEGYGQQWSWQVPSITSLSSLTAIEGYPLKHHLTADLPVTWRISGGADADDFVLAGPGNTLQFVGRNAPADKTSYAVQVAASHGGMERTQDLAISVEEVPVWESETTALVARMATAPSITQQIAYNTLIRSIKTSGAWAKLIGLKVLAVHSRQAALLDWINPAYDMADVEGPVFTINRGMAGDGVHSFAIPFNPRTPGTALYSQDSATLGLWMNAFGGQTRAVFGNTNTRLGISLTGTLGHALHNLAADVALYGGNHVAARRASAAGYDLFKDGVLERNIATASALPTSTNFTLLGAAGGFTTGRVAACYWGSGTLTDQEMAAINTALSAYRSGVGAS